VGLVTGSRAGSAKTGRGHFLQHSTAASQQLPFTEFLAKMKLGRLRNTKKKRPFQADREFRRAKRQLRRKDTTRGKRWAKLANLSKIRDMLKNTKDSISSQDLMTAPSD